MPLAITPLVLSQLPIKRRGLTDFTYSRYLVPFLMGYQGWALFMDADMIAVGDVGEVFGLADEQYAVMVVKNPDLRFEWPSLMLFNCAKCRALTPQFIETGEPQKFDWGPVGELPGEWNRAVGYEPIGDAKVLHYTAGIPVFAETRHLGGEEQWTYWANIARGTVGWAELMGDSVHAELVRTGGRGV